VRHIIVAPSRTGTGTGRASAVASGACQPVVPDSVGGAADGASCCLAATGPHTATGSCAASSPPWKSPARGRGRAACCARVACTRSLASRRIDEALLLRDCCRRRARPAAGPPPTYRTRAATDATLRYELRRGLP
jgi:hypothetical protein